MRVFLSAYPDFTLAIPMDDVGAMMLYDQKTEKIVHYDQKSRCTFISLPCLFNMPDIEVPHGIILREFNSKENKAVILTGEIKRDIEIPDEEFYPIPKTLSTMKFASLFKSIKFKEKPILLLNMKRLPEILEKEYKSASEKQYPVEQSAPEEVSKPASTVPKEVVEEPPTVPAVVSTPVPSAPKEVVEEPPTVPEVVSKPAPPPPKEVVEEPPKVTVLTSESVLSATKEIIEESLIIPEKVIEEPVEVSDPSITFDEIVEICEIIEEPPITTLETFQPSTSTPDEVIAESAQAPAAKAPIAEVSVFEALVVEAIEATDSSLTFDEVIEIFENINVPEDSDASLTFDEVIEICEIIEEPPISSAVTTDLSSVTQNKVIEEHAEAPVAEVLETTEATDTSITIDEVIEICDVIEVCDIIEEPPITTSAISELSPSTPIEVIEEAIEISYSSSMILNDVIDVIEESTGVSDLLTFDETIEICDDNDEN